MARARKWLQGVSDWLEAGAHRATIVNVVMLSAILAIADSAALYMMVGGGIVLLAGGRFFLGAVGRTYACRRAMNPYQLALIWIPGGLAVCLAVAALGLVTADSAPRLAYGLGALLFAVENAMLTLAGAELSAEPAPGTAVGEAA
ncbi:hypothetical protein [Bradyrhizobium sp. WD16]|uniref:hypothetical protein n=1 Tax=Bradyrhizobium sp. WD16 TaxID=1521768 RepID=UPI0020A376D6|nr:hypothetical protein [Bradyrhizobium sp. WD16]UTD27510.1 hypothetical protein DB459_11820 [Bradyrhizobium sp. WD16]